MSSIFGSHSEYEILHVTKGILGDYNLLYLLDLSPHQFSYFWQVPDWHWTLETLEKTDIAAAVPANALVQAVLA